MMEWFETLFYGVGRKVKAVAKWTFIVTFFAMVVSGVLGMVGALFDEESLPFVLVIPVGVFVALCGVLFSSWLLHGFGTLIEKAETDLEKDSAPSVVKTQPLVTARKCEVCGRMVGVNETYCTACGHVVSGGAHHTVQANDGWKCTSCSRVNPKYQTTCSCGAKKPRQ